MSARCRRRRRRRRRCRCRDDRRCRWIKAAADAAAAAAAADERRDDAAAAAAASAAADAAEGRRAPPPPTLPLGPSSRGRGVSLGGKLEMQGADEIRQARQRHRHRHGGLALQLAVGELQPEPLGQFLRAGRVRLQGSLGRPLF